ncbi:MAG: PKD domain-containing protein [Acidimicrobiia bacterium]|nr:PKD domain-containing protein [Acidimicrobiia bacterium]
MRGTQYISVCVREEDGSGRPSLDGRPGRSRSRVLRFAFVLLTILTAAAVLLDSGEPARADGFDFTCDTAPDPPSTPATEVEVLSGVNLTFDGTTPAGTRHRELSPFPVGLTNLDGAPNIPFGGPMRPVDVDGDGTVDLSFGFGLRLSTAPPDDGSPTGASPLQQLFNENYGLANDYTIFGVDRPYVKVLGLDLRVRRAVGSELSAYKGQFGIAVKFRHADGSRSATLVRIGIDALPAGDESRRFPGEARIGLAFKGRVAGRDENGFWGVGQEFVYSDLGEGEAPPPLGVDFTLDDIPLRANGLPRFNPDGSVVTDQRVLDVATGWDSAPTDLGLGAAQICRRIADFDSTMHVAWNRAGETTANGLDIRLRSGVGTGLAGSDEFAIEGRMAGIADRLDWTVHPGDMSIVRSEETSMDLLLQRFQMAAPADDVPFVASGAVSGLPERSYVTATRDASGSFAGARLDFCPTTEVSPGVPVVPCSGATPVHPARVDVTAQNFFPGDPAAADLPDAPVESERNHLVYGLQRPRADLPRRLYRISAGLPGVAHAGFDTSGVNAPGSGVQVRLLTEEARDVDVRARVDGRTRLDFRNQGTLLDIWGSVAKLPQDLTASYVSRPGTAFRVDYTASGAMPLAGAAYVEGPGTEAAAPDPNSHLVAYAQFEIGADGGGGLPRRATLTLNRHQRLERERGVFPPSRNTESVLVLDTDAATRVRAGAIVTDHGDREARVRTRLHADVTLPRYVKATWVEDPAERLTGVDVEACPPPVPRPVPWPVPRPREVVPCPDNSLLVTVVRGGVPKWGDGDLLAAPALPAIPDGSDGDTAEQPPFTDWADEGIRAVFPDSAYPDVWGVRAGLRNLTQAAYRVAPQQFCLRTRPTGGPFVANIYDDADTGVYVNAVLNHLPPQILARIQRGDGGSASPWIWVNTESCDITTPPVNGPPADDSTDLRLSGVVRLGSGAALAAMGTDPPGLPVREDPRDLARRPGADVVARVAHGNWGVHLRLVLDVPRHVMIWDPLACTAATETEELQRCQDRLRYEVDDVEGIQVRYRSTKANLGDMTAQVKAQSGTDWYEIKAELGRIPGSLDGRFRLVTNRRLPWTDAEARFTAASPLERIKADVYHLNRLAYVGPPGNNDGRNIVPTYSLDLTGVAATLDLQARLRSAEAPNDTPDTQTYMCPGREYVGRGSPEMTYLHASLDLQGADAIRLDMRRGRDSMQERDSADTPQTALALRSNSPVSGSAKLRIDKIGFGAESDPLWGYYDYCIDFDLPVEIVLTDVTDIHVGQAAAKLVLDMSDADWGAGADIEGRFHETYFDAATGGYVDGGGVYYVFRPYVHFEVIGLDVIHYETTDWRRAVGVIGTDWSCGGTICFRDGLENVFDIDAVRLDDVRVGGYVSGEFIVDPLFTAGQRRFLWLQDLGGFGLIRPGAWLYEMIRDMSRSPLDFRVPQIFAFPGLLVPVSYTTPPTNCGLQETANAAIGQDLTTYRIVVENECRITPSTGWYRYTKVYVVARHPNGQIRWLRQVKTPDFPGAVTGWAANGWPQPWRFAVTITPQGDGSAYVTVDRRRTGGGGTGDVRRGHLDASGYGPFYDDAIPPGVAQYGSVGSPLTLTGPPPFPNRRVWHFGDGAQDGAATESAVHTYALPGSYYAFYLDYGSDGDIVGAGRFVVNIS